MSTDFERELSALLHDATPEPPASLTPPTVATLTELPARTDAEIVELSPERAPGSPRRWTPLLAAAAVVAVGGGIAAVAALSSSHGHTPAATQSPTPNPTVHRSPSPTEDLQRCHTSVFVVRGGTLVQHGTTGTVHAFFRGRHNPAACSVRLPESIEIGRKIGSRPSQAPAGPHRLAVLPAHGTVVITVPVHIHGNCTHVPGKQGKHLILDFTERGAGFTLTYPLNVADCTLMPGAWSFRSTKA